MSRETVFSESARFGLKTGVDTLANAVKVTLGPKGRNVILPNKYGYPHITKDGVTVAKSIEIADELQQMGAQIVKEVASKTADEAGDGTTTATILVQELINTGLKQLAAGVNPIFLKRGMEIATKDIVSSITELSQEVGDDLEKIKQIATISANNDEVIGELITEAIRKVNKDGIITVESTQGTETEVIFTEGMKFDRGYISPFFITDPEKLQTVLDNPMILFVDRAIHKFEEIFEILRGCRENNKSLLIIAEDIVGDALPTLIANRVRANLQVAVVKAPYFGEKRSETLEDLAIFTGGVVQSDVKGQKLSQFQPSMFGSAERVIITKDSTTIINGKGTPEVLNVRVQSLRNQISQTKDEFDREKLQERLAKLSGGAAIIRVGAMTEVEMKEKKDRVDDALSATKAALAEGVVEGGGCTFIKIAKQLSNFVPVGNDEVNQGYKLVIKAIEAPFKQICSNAGISGDMLLPKIEGDQGYNALTDKIENLIERGIIDPAKVLRVALEYAVSSASMFLTTECVVVEKQEETCNCQQPQGMMNGMM